MKCEKAVQMMRNKERVRKVREKIKQQREGVKGITG